MKTFLFAILLTPILALASAGEAVLDKAPDRSGNLPALQNGARIFVNYCQNCHAASYMRYNRLGDLGIDEAQIKSNLIFSDAKPGDIMKVAMQSADAKIWFGAAPPDLTIIARARSSEAGSGADWLYTYLRGFYRDDTRPTGWNNTLFPSVAMPHVLWELQGQQILEKDHQLKLVKPGSLKPEAYDELVGDLVGFLQYMGEPVAEKRQRVGIFVLIGLAVLLAFSYALKRAFWKDVH